MYSKYVPALRTVLVSIAAFAAAALPAMADQTYGLGQGGSPDAAGWQSAAQGFNASLSPLLTALLPVYVVVMAIWMGPRLLKKLLTMAVH